MKIFGVTNRKDYDSIDSVGVTIKNNWLTLYFLSGGVIGASTKMYKPLINPYHFRALLDEALDNNDEVTERIIEYVERKTKVKFG
jgi:hypothetical protein